MDACALSLLISFVLAGFAVCQDSYASANTIDNVGSHEVTSGVLDRLASLLDKLSFLEQRFNALDQRISTVDQRFNAYDQRMTSQDQRITILDQSVTNHIEELRHQVNDLVSQSKDLDAACAGLGDVSDNATSTSTTGESAVEEKPKIPFRLKRVTKKETAHSYLVTLEYEASSKPTVLYRKEYGSPPIPLEEQEMNRVVVEIPKEPHAYGSSVDFFFSDDYLYAQLNIDGTPEEMDIPEIHFKVSPGRDITFQSGEPIKLNFTLNVDGGEDIIEKDYIETRFLVKSDSQDNVVNAYHSFNVHRKAGQPAPISLNMTDFEGSMGHRHGTVLFNSSKADMEGILEALFFFRYNCSQNCLLKSLVRSYAIKFYRNDHEGPFPKGFIGVIHDDYKAPDAFQFYCVNNESNCFVSCDVVGDRVSSVSISREGGDDWQSDNDGFSFTRNGWGGAVLSLPNVTLADTGDYLCTASSGAREISEVLHLQVVEPADIDEERSGVMTHDNGSVSAFCVAKGNPAPNVTFDLDLDQREYEVTTVHPGNSTTKTEIFISDPDVASSIYQYSCTATNVPKDDLMFWHLIDVYTMSHPNSNQSFFDNY